MQLASIRAKNYRTLEDIKIDFSKKYCTISGKNNAGKSALIRLLTALFQKNSRYWLDHENDIDYGSDKTQWVKEKVDIYVEYNIKILKQDDPALISFIEKIAEIKLSTDLSLKVIYTVSSDEKLRIKIIINEKEIDIKAAKDIDAKIKDSNLLFLYNSTVKHDDIYLGRSGRKLFYDYVLSEDEKKELNIAGKKIDSKLKRLAREQREGLNDILGRLSEKYDVEFSLPEGYATRRMPLSINLKDRNVEVPLDDWGSGTQNKTHIFMAILQANRIKITDSPNDKITPIVVIEEPESFLHPSAQAEFGSILNALASDLGIQVIVTTHSPYLLNRDDPSSNILLCRAIERDKAFETRQVNTDKDQWMAPFADHLGIESKEFDNWKLLFANHQNKILLVEGDIDKEYFNYFQTKKLSINNLNKDIEIVPYGGKDTLKNTLLVKFVLSKFNGVFITYDFDAHNDCKKALESLGLKEKRNFIPLGLNSPGKKAIEGLLPDSVVSSVYSKKTDLVRQLSSGNSEERKSANNILKREYLQEFMKRSDYAKDELAGFEKVILLINKFYKNNNK